MAEYEQAVFISYAWGGEREDIVNEIDETLQQRGVRIVRDKRALGYKGSIKEFMERIGRGSCIIVVISDKYLRSPNCMFELVEIAENKQFHDRIFPVVLTDANIYDPLKRIEYIKFWEGKRKDLAKAMKTLDPANLHGIREEMDDYDRIRDKISGITSILKDMNTLTPDMHRDSEFSNLYDAIVARLRESSTDVTTEFDELTKRAEADRKAKEEAARLDAQKAEEELLAKAEAEHLSQQRAEEERLAKAKMEADRRAKEEADRLAAQRAEAERLAEQRAEEERLAQAKAEADRIAAQKAEAERLAHQKAEEERLAKAKAEADRKAKEESDRLAAQKAEAERLAQQKAEEERKAKEKVVPVAANIAPVSVAPVRKKPASKGLMYGIGVVVALAVIGIAVVGIAFSMLKGGDKNTFASTPTTNAIVASATEASAIDAPVTPTTAPVNTATIAPTPIGGGGGKIAFVSDGGIYSVNVDGSGLTRLADGSDPSWSPDGKRIAFSYFDDIYIMNADGTGVMPIPNECYQGGELTSPTWSPDGKYIAFQYKKRGSILILATWADMSSNCWSQIAQAAGSPAWSPNGMQIAYEGLYPTQKDGLSSDIYVMNADGSNQRQLTYDFPNSSSSPVWSPDGKHISFVSGRDGEYGNLGIYVMNADGSGQTRLTSNQSYAQDPAWSPDGKQIAFVVYWSEEPSGIYLMNADGSGQTRLTIDMENLWSPTWQP